MSECCGSGSVVVFLLVVVEFQCSSWIYFFLILWSCTTRYLSRDQKKKCMYKLTNTNIFFILKMTTSMCRLVLPCCDDT